MDKKYMAVGSSMLILKLLEQQDMYGYQIIKELEIRSERVFTLKERTAENGRERKYYIITENGRKLLHDKLKEWDSFQTAVNQVIGGAVFG